MLRLTLPLALLLIAAVIAVVSDRPLPRADFTFVNRGDVSTLDLHRMSWMQELRAAKIIGEGLVNNDVLSWDYTIIPAAAERWELSPDGRTYTFHLRPDARWSNGDPVTAGDFLYAWRRAMLPDTGCDYIGFFKLINGAAEFIEWREQAIADYASSGGGDAAAAILWEQTRGEFASRVGVTALDDTTLRVELVRPVPYFLELCAFASFFPMYAKGLEAVERPDPRTGRMQSTEDWTRPPRLISNGPFRLSLWRFKRDMRFEANPHYWNRAALNVQTISMVSIDDPNAALLAFNTGAVDWVTDIVVPYRGDVLAEKDRFYAEHAAEVASLRAQGLDQFEVDRCLPPDPRANVHAVPAFGTYWYNFNCRAKLPDGRPNPFHDARVRRAFAMTIDRKALVEQVVRTGNPVVTTIIPPGSIPGYESPAGCSHNPEAARKLLAEAGYPGGAGFITVELLFNKDQGHDRIAEAIAKDWERTLGVRTMLVTKEIRVFREDLRKGNFMTSRAGWYGDYGDPTTFLDVSRSWDGNNDRGYNNPKFDQLLRDAEVEPDAAKRMAMLSRAEQILVAEDLPMVPLFQQVSLYSFDAHRVAGVNCHPRTDQQVGLIDILGDGKGADLPLPMRKPPPEHH